MNKIIVSIILAVILVLGINKITDAIFYVEKPEKSAYQVASVVTTATSSETTTENAGSGDIMTLLASANADDAGIGSFEYDVPAGYYALCTKNIKAYGG